MSDHEVHTFGDCRQCDTQVADDFAHDMARLQVMTFTLDYLAAPDLEAKRTAFRRLIDRYRNDEAVAA